MGKETLNRGDVREGVFNYGRLNGIVRVTFNTGKVRAPALCRPRRARAPRAPRALTAANLHPPSPPPPPPLAPQVSFAQFAHGNRRGWVRGRALLELEDSWAEETKELRENERKAKRAVELLEKLNMFGMAGVTAKAAQRKEIAAMLEDEMAGSRAKKDAKKSADGGASGMGIMQAFMVGGEDRV